MIFKNKASTTSPSQASAVCVRKLTVQALLQKLNGFIGKIALKRHISHNFAHLTLNITILLETVNSEGIVK